MSKRSVRGDPVSCQSCRSKKLRCNRVQPCSNCTARKITCNFLNPPRRHIEATSDLPGNADILKRLERLESLILSRHTFHDSHVAGSQAPTPLSGDVLASDSHQTQENDLQLLESVEANEDPLLVPSSKSMAFAINNMGEILETQTDLGKLGYFTERKQLNGILIKFPTYRIASMLFDSYEVNVDYVCRILHVPTVRNLMKRCYLRLGQGQPIPLGQAGLLLSMFALSAFFYQPAAGSEVVTTEDDAVQLAKFWSNSALDVLDQSHRSSLGTLEDIQACILAKYVTYHLDGFSARARLLSTTAASMARDLRLHRLDADNGSVVDRQTSPRVAIDREVKRRVMWHIVATDWLQSTISGPQEGMYFIHPGHLHVRFPKDCNDDEITFDELDAPETDPQPTSMTFYLARVQLAHICREMVDTLPLETAKLMQVPYEHIFDIDKKFEDFMSSLPFFLQSDAESREKSRALEVVYPKICIMRYCIMTAAHSRRCRLHQKFLLRVSSNPRYVFSRRACLESARVVIQGYEYHGRVVDSPSTSTTTARMAMVVHYTHLALTIMVMDICFNTDEADAEERKAEVADAFRMLERDRQVSPLLDRSLNSLRAILAKHEVQLPEDSMISVEDRGCNSNQVAEMSEADTLYGGCNPPTILGYDIESSGFTMEASSLDEFWQIANSPDINFDPVAWDTIFSSLNSRPI